MRLIDADRIPFDMVMQNPFDEQSEKVEVIEKRKIEQMPTVQAIPIPDNTTNGDVIKAMFPNISVYEHGSTYSVNNEYNFNSTWWNAPYKPIKNLDNADKSGLEFADMPTLQSAT